MKKFFFLALVVCGSFVFARFCLASPNAALKPAVDRVETPSPAALVNQNETPIKVENGEDLLVEKMKPQKIKFDAVKDLESAQEPEKQYREIKNQKDIVIEKETRSNETNQKVLEIGN